MRRESQGGGPRRSSADSNAPYAPNRMDDFLRQRASLPEQGSYPRSMDDFVLQQQQLLLRQEQQFQGHQQQHRGSGMMYGGGAQASAAGTMPSLEDISRAEEILAAARDAITGGSSSSSRPSQFASMPEDYSPTRSMLNQPETRWASSAAYSTGPLRAPGNTANAPIGASGLSNQDFQLLLSKQNQAMSLATANEQQQQFMLMRQRQAMYNQMPAENMAVLESLLLRQEEERLLMGKHQRSSIGGGDEDDSSPRPKKFGRASFPGMDPHQFAPQMMASGDSKTMGFMGQGFGSPNLPILRSKPRKRRAVTFPVKFMETLLANYDERYVAWLPDGKSFVIIHPEQFVEKVLANTFKNSKYASFVRKLNRWGFARLTSGTGTDCFYHPLFQRDRMDLAAQMLCMPRNDSASAKKRAALGIQPAPAPIITAADVDPKDRPSLAGVERFFAGAKDKDDASSDSDGRADHGKEAAASSSQDAAASSNEGGDKSSARET